MSGPHEKGCVQCGAEPYNPATGYCEAHEGKPGIDYCPHTPSCPSPGICRSRIRRARSAGDAMSAVQPGSLASMASALIAALKEKLPPNIGATLVMFDYGDAGNIAYASTAERAGMIKALRNLLSAWELGNLGDVQDEKDKS